jgi:hypothetical protein
MIVTEPAQCLNDCATDAAGRRHLTRRRVLQDDLLPAKLHAT